MFPYHVDNISADGTALTRAPHNFTLRLNTEVKYNNTTSGSETKNLTYSMIKTAETIFSIDNKTLRNITKTFKGVRKLANAVLGNNAKVKKMESIGKIWDQLKDTVETTTSRSNEYATSYTMSITTAANYQDTLYMNESTQYIWRYPVLQVPAPSWLIGETKESAGSFDKSLVIEQQSYIT